MTDLAFRHELGQGEDRLLNWRVGVDPVLVVEVDVVGVEAPQRELSRWPGPSPTWEIMPNLVASTTS